MALQWLLLGVVAGVEAAILVLLSAPLPHAVAAQVLEFVKTILQPGLAVIPFAIFQLLEVYWKYEHRINCSKDVCSPLERDRFQRSLDEAFHQDIRGARRRTGWLTWLVFKSQRNALLAIAAAFLYWLLFRIAKMQQDLMQEEERVKRTKEQ